jgi:octaprenyl-diphosphate synthase
LTALLAEDFAKVNAEILARMQSRVPLIPELAGHIVAAGGKRLRPLLTLACARLCGYRGEHHIRLAACVEFIHTATLLHDDVVDGSALRRGASTANSLWGNSAPVLVGDFLFSRAFQLMVETGSLEVLKILSDAAAIIAEGEVMQLMAQNNIATPESAYLDVIAAKTAALFAAAARVGPVLGGRPDTEKDALERYGQSVGMAFQLVDDALDYSAKRASLGKNIGGDFREGKATLPIIIAYARGSDPERAFLRRMIDDLAQEPGDFERAVELIERHGGLKATLAKAREFADAARGALALFPDSEFRQALRDLADFSVERDY